MRKGLREERWRVMPSLVFDTPLSVSVVQITLTLLCLALIFLWFLFVFVDCG